MSSDAGSAAWHLAEFKKDWEAYQYFLDNSGSVGVKAILMRSVFQNISTMQLRLIVEKHGWRLTPPLKQWLAKANSKCVASLVVEDGFNRVKDKLGKQRNHIGREARAFGTLLQKKVLSQVHTYGEIEPHPMSSVRTATLGPPATGRP